MNFPSSERNGYNLSGCLIINSSLIFTKTKHNYVTQICLYPQLENKQRIKPESLLRVDMSRLRWKIRQKVLKTWQKSAQIVLEFLKKVLEI